LGSFYRLAELPVRLIPNVRYGTERYPERVARRLRGTNIAAGIAAASVGLFAVWRFLEGAEHWKYTAIVAIVLGLIPLLHRFGSLAAPMALVAVAFIWGFWLTLRGGTASGTTFVYFTACALGILTLGAEHAFLSFMIGAVGTGLLIVLHTGVVRDLSSYPISPLTFAINVISNSAALYLIVFYAVRQFTRAEEVLEERTHQLELANLAKSRFLAAASHDLRQPLHALGLFVAQLPSHVKSTEGGRLVEQIDAAVTSMNELFNALLDISKLDAGVLSTNVTEFPIVQVLTRIERTFAEAAHDKGLSFQMVLSSAWVRSDPILLERIVLNLVSNAVRYTTSGGVVVGCRRRGDTVRIEVWDSGPGIPEDQRRKIFGEFYCLAEGNAPGGLGLGLAIVDRLCNLLGHRVELNSRLGRGSHFTVTVPLAVQPPAGMQTQAGLSLSIADPARGKRVLVIDDDALVLDSMRGILQSWGCQVQTAASGDAALAALAQSGGLPDLIISDSALADGETGIETIARLREAVGARIPAFVITGDIAPERLREASAAGFHLLHKPVSPMALRTTLNRLMKTRLAP
jgi:signal transduction histidine kinase